MYCVYVCIFNVFVFLLCVVFDNLSTFLVTKRWSKLSVVTPPATKMSLPIFKQAWFILMKIMIWMGRDSDHDHCDHHYDHGDQVPRHIHVDEDDGALDEVGVGQTGTPLVCIWSLHHRGWR